MPALSAEESEEEAEDEELPGAAVPVDDAVPVLLADDGDEEPESKSEAVTLKQGT